MNTKLNMVSVGEAAEVKSGFAFKSEDYRNDGIKLVRIGNLNGNGLEFSNEAVCVPKQYGETYSDFLLNEGDVLIAMSGATTGKLAFVKEQNLPCLLNQRVGRFSVNPKELDSKYLFSYLSQESVRRKILGDAGGSAQPNVSPSQLKEIKIPLPPLPIQKRIAAILEKADAGREKRRQTIELTEKFLQSAFLEMFGDPVTNPKGWEISTLDSVCSKIADGTHFSPPNSEGGKYKYITAKNIKEHGFDFTNLTYVDEDAHRNIYKRCNPEFGDVLYIKDGVTTGIAMVNTLKEEFSLLSSVALFKLNNVINCHYLVHYLNNSSVYDSIRRSMGGAAITRLTIQKLRPIRLILPPLSLQQKFAALVEKIEAMRAKQRMSEKELENLFQSLMQRAFRGELV